MKKRVLLIGRHEVLMDRLVNLLEQAGFEAVPTLDDERALEAIEGQPLDLIVIGGGIPPSSRSRLTEAAEQHKPKAPVVEHFGAPQALVAAAKNALGIADD